MHCIHSADEEPDELSMSFAEFPDEITAHCLSFVLCLRKLSKVAFVNRQLHRACYAPEAWARLEITISEAALAHRGLVPLALTAWKRCACLRLAAGPGRASVAAELGDAGFVPPLEVDGSGPLMLFYMGAFPCLVPGQRMQTHFFEPRYLWMCAQLLGPPPPSGAPVRVVELDHANGNGVPLPSFGFVTRLRAGALDVAEGAIGIVAEIHNYQWNPDGTIDVTFKATRRFSVLEVLKEEVPGNQSAAQLNVAYYGPHCSTSATSKFLKQGHRTMFGFGQLASVLGMVKLFQSYFCLIGYVLMRLIFQTLGVCIFLRDRLQGVTLVVLAAANA